MSPQLLNIDIRKTPLVVAEAVYDAPSWVIQHQQELLGLVNKHGSARVRGLGLRKASDAVAVFHNLAADLMIEKEAFAARKLYSTGVYSSSAWPQNQGMCMHHELSYALRFPGLMLFACLEAPDEGGATAVADSPSVLDALPSDLVKRFEQEGWLLTRNYNGEIGVTYGEAFGTDNRSAIESYCRSNDIEWEWQPDGGLRTIQRRSAVIRHPVSGLRCWFNQVAFLNEWTIDPEVREFLIDAYGEDALPFNTKYGDGDAIGKDVVEVINQAYADNTFSEPWVAGDLMLVDNIRTAHSREAFKGAREILVAMAHAQVRPQEMSSIVKDASR
jgi:alpha-ketoglutarate-dependent taurine dioxygenase